jgi:hypothetical protein
MHAPIGQGACTEAWTCQVTHSCSWLPSKLEVLYVTVYMGERQIVKCKNILKNLKKATKCCGSFLVECARYNNFPSVLEKISQNILTAEFLQ